MNNIDINTYTIHFDGLPEVSLHAFLEICNDNFKTTLTDEELTLIFKEYCYLDNWCDGGDEEDIPKFHYIEGVSAYHTISDDDIIDDDVMLNSNVIFNDDGKPVLIQY